MGAIFSFILDFVLIGLLAAGIVYAIRLMRQIAGLRASHADMERFVSEFRATVQRAESGIRGLKQAARTSGDDLEQFIEKARTIRDELHYLTESADQIANRLSDKAAAISRAAATEGAPSRQPSAPEAAKKPPDETKAASSAVVTPLKPAKGPDENKASVAAIAPTSAAEKELLQALEKLG